MTDYKIKIIGLEKLKNAFEKSPKTVFIEMSRAIKTSVNIIRPMMMREAPSATSKMRMNIQSKSSGLRGEVGPNLSVTPYAHFVHAGTRPHIIEPRVKKALYWSGALHPVKRVHHPGTKANPFVERTTRSATKPINDIFKNAINRIIKTLVK